MLYTCWTQFSSPGCHDGDNIKDAITEYIYQNELAPPVSVMAVENDKVKVFNYKVKLEEAN